MSYTLDLARKSVFTAHNAWFIEPTGKDDLYFFWRHSGDNVTGKSIIQLARWDPETEAWSFSAEFNTPQPDGQTRKLQHIVPMGRGEQTWHLAIYAFGNDTDTNATRTLYAGVITVDSDSSMTVGGLTTLIRSNYRGFETHVGWGYSTTEGAINYVTQGGPFDDIERIARVSRNEYTLSVLDDVEMGRHWSARQVLSPIHYAFDDSNADVIARRKGNSAGLRYIGQNAYQRSSGAWSLVDAIGAGQTTGETGADYVHPSLGLLRTGSSSRSYIAAHFYTENASNPWRTANHVINIHYMKHDARGDLLYGPFYNGINTAADAPGEAVFHLPSTAYLDSRTEALGWTGRPTPVSSLPQAGVIIVNESLELVAYHFLLNKTTLAQTMKGPFTLGLIQSDLVSGSEFHAVEHRSNLASFIWQSSADSIWYHAPLTHEFITDVVPHLRMNRRASIRAPGGVHDPSVQDSIRNPGNGVFV